jgi:hypothetical protein
MGEDKGRVHRNAAATELIKSRAPDQNPNTIPASRLVRAGRRITAGSQFPNETRHSASQWRSNPGPVESSSH